MKKSHFWIAFSLILLFGAFVRLYMLGSIPVSLYWDEMAMFVDARSVAETGRDMHNKPWLQALFISYGDFKLPVYIWFASLVVKIVGATEFALRLPSALAGIGTIILAGVIAKLLFFGDTVQKTSKDDTKSLDFLKKGLFLSTMFVVATTPWSILFSRTAFEGHLGQFWLALSIVLALLSKKKKFLLFLSPIIAALATYTYFSVRFVWVPVFILLMILMNWSKIIEAMTAFTKKWKFKELTPVVSFLFLQLLVPVMLFALLLVPMIKSPVYADSNTFRYGTDSVLNMKDWPIISNQYREMGGNGKIDRLLYHRYTFPARELLKNYSDNLSLEYLFMSGDPNLRHGTGHHGLFLLIFLPIFLVGIYQMARKYRPQLLLLFSWWIVAILPASVPENTPHALRSLNALVPLSIMVAFGLFKIIQWILNQKLKYFYISILAGALFVSLLDFYVFYFEQYPKISASDWQNGYKEVAQEIIAQKDSVDEVWVLPFDDRFYLWVLGYGDYPFTEIQNWKTEGYQFKSFDNITFGKTEDEALTGSADKTILLLGRTKDLPDIEATSEAIRIPTEKGFIPNTVTDEEYGYVLYTAQ